MASSNAFFFDSPFPESLSGLFVGCLKSDPIRDLLLSLPKDWFSATWVYLPNFIVGAL
jgi:hypothetical protein